MSANMGIAMSLGVTIYQSPPAELRDVLFVDCTSAIWPRHDRI